MLEYKREMEVLEDKVAKLNAEAANFRADLAEQACCYHINSLVSFASSVSNQQLHAGVQAKKRCSGRGGGKAEC